MEGEMQEPENSAFKENVKALRDDAAALRDSAVENYKKVRDRAGEYQTQAKEVIDQLADYCDQNPQKAAIIAGATGVGLGLILGMLMRSR